MKKYFEFWDKDVFILINAVLFIILLAGAAIAFYNGIGISGHNWPLYVMIFLLVIFFLHGLIIKIVQKKFILHPNKKYFASMVLKKDGEPIELSSPFWIKGKVINIDWEDGYNIVMYYKEITLTKKITSYFNKVAVSMNMNITIGLEKTPSAIEFFRLLKIYQPEEIRKGLISVDKYLDDMLNRIHTANYMLFNESLKKYLEGELSKSQLISDLTRNFHAPYIEFPGRSKECQYRFWNIEIAGYK